MGGVWDYSITYIRDSDLLKKLAGLFAGLSHLQPLLLVTTNANYLLDRFCMERCCSSEYVSRIVTSIIFMEILSIIVVRIALLIGLKYSNIWSDATAQNLVEHSQTEELVRDIISTIILWVIFLGYIQILYAFTSGGKKGHMHWFYASLLIQHFLNSLITGSIGFWEVGRALWYLVTLPMCPIIVFFYQLIIHSWIRNNGPRDAEYIVVKWQIVLALLLSCIATILWTAGYVIPHILNLTMTKEGAELNLTNPNNPGKITAKWISRALRVYTVESGATKSLTIKSTEAVPVKVTIRSITVALTNATPSTVVRYPNKEATVESTKTAKVTATVTPDNKTVTITITGTAVDPEIPEYSEKVTGVSVTISKIHLALEHSGGIKVAGGPGTGTSVNVLGCSCYPDHGHYINKISKDSDIWKEEWEGEKCLFAACYYQGANTNTDPKLLMLHVSGNTLTTRYYGNSSGWKIINSSIFHNKLDELQRTGSISGSLGSKAANDPGHNTNYNKALFYGDGRWRNLFPWNWGKLTPTWIPLLMQGLSVGAVGSIFPNLIPKTLTCPKTTRNLSVINMFLVTLPHIFNVMLGDMDLLARIGVGAPWEGDFHTVWSLYIFYILAILFAIFNVHYPEWALSTFLRNNTWFVFLMILFTDVLNETFNAISRAGICSQKAAVGGKKNHPCLHNKIAFLTDAYNEIQKEDTRDKYKAVYGHAKALVYKRHKLKLNSTHLDLIASGLLDSDLQKIDHEIQAECEKMLKWQAERREYAEKCIQANIDYEKQMASEQIELEKQQLNEQVEWDKTRDLRVNSWRTFQSKVDSKEFKLGAFKGIETKREARNEIDLESQKNSIAASKTLRQNKKKKILEELASYKTSWR